VIRTHDLLLRRQLLYPAELPDLSNEKGSEQYLHTAYCLFSRRGDRIRTPAGAACDTLVSNQMRYLSFLFFSSGRQDSNLRPSGPKPDALPGCATPRVILLVKLSLDFVNCQLLFLLFKIGVEEAGFEPAVPLRVRQFSKLLVSATHPSLLLSVLGCKYRGLPFRKTNICAKKLYQKLQLPIFEKVLITQSVHYELELPL
jgi:hypothetical protein